MVKKNKLYKHHKSKAFFYVRNFSFVFLGLISVGSAVAVPTYIASIKNVEISIKADSKDENKNDVEQSLDNQEESEELEQY